MKKCSHCLCEKTFTEFGKKSGSKDGLHYACKICVNVFNKKNREKRIPSKVGGVKTSNGYEKQCTQCKIVKPLDMFTLRKGSKDGHRANCKVCKAISDLQWSERNQERKIESGKSYYLQNREDVRKQQHESYLLNKDKIQAANKRWYLENIEKVAEQKRLKRIANVEKYREDRRKDYVKNKARYVAQARMREAHIKRATPPWADLKMIEAAYVASDLLNQVTGEWHHVDHIIPLRGKLVSGLHVHTNLRVLPGPENLSKSNKFEVI